MSLLLILFIFFSSNLYGYEIIKPERRDNMYVKGAYGYNYESQRYSHLDYIAKEYDDSDRDLGEHLEDYIDSIQEDDE